MKYPAVVLFNQVGMQIGLQCPPQIRHHLPAVTNLLPYLACGLTLVSQHGIGTECFAEVVLLKIVKSDLLQITGLQHHRMERFNLMVIEWESEDIGELGMTSVEL